MDDISKGKKPVSRETEFPEVEESTRGEVGLSQGDSICTLVLFLQVIKKYRDRFPPHRHTLKP